MSNGSLKNGFFLVGAFKDLFTNILCSVKLGLLIGLWGEGNGTPLQYFCLENPIFGGAW